MSLLNYKEIKNIFNRMQKFIISNYIIVKLEGGKTNIYVDNKFFKQCKYLLLNIPKKIISKLEDINSVDDAAEILNNKMEGNLQGI